MWPRLIEWGDWTLRSYDAILLAAIAVGFYFLFREGRKAGFPLRKLVLLVTGVLAFALVGARINGWLFWFGHDESQLSLDIVATHHGMTAFGGIAGALLFAVPFAYIQRWNGWRLLDILVPVLVLCEGIQRVGCLLNGCCYGKVLPGFTGMYLPDIMGVWANRFPSQIATGIFCLALFFYLRKFSRQSHATGEVFLQYLILYATGRLILDFLRADEPIALGMLSAHQVAAVLMLLVAAFIVMWRSEHRPVSEPEESNLFI